MAHRCRRLQLAVLVLAVNLVASQAPLVPAGAAQTVVVSAMPIEESPRILDGRVYSIAEAGDRIVVGGTFSKARDWNSNTEVARAGILAFDRHTGLIDPAFAPTFDRDVDSIVADPGGAAVFVGGSFKNVNGTARSGLVKLLLADGSIDPAFTGKANKRVSDMALSGGQLIVAGQFTKLSNKPRSLLGAVDPVTGAAMTTLTVSVAGPRHTNAAYIQEMDVSPDGRWLAIVGNFLTADSLPREQIALIDLSTSPPSVANWATNRFHEECASVFAATYLRDVAFSPDSSFFVVATTGAFFANRLCDTATRWEAGHLGAGQQPTWVNYTGGDTLWHTIVTDAAVYVGGHQRWLNNPNPSPRGDNDGPGSVRRQGIGALDPLTGVPLSWNPGRHRGRGVEAFLATDEHLYVGSDTTAFGGVNRHRLAVLPVSGGTPNPPPEVLTLPVSLYLVRSNGLVERSAFDGITVGPATAVSGPGIDGIDWSSARDGFVQHGQAVYFGANSAYYKRTFDGTTFGPAANLSTSVGYVDKDYNLTPYDQPYGVSTTRAAAYHQGRIYYTKTTDSRLWWRWYSLESGIIGAQEFVASADSWSGATGLEVAGGALYVSWSDNRLYRAPVAATTVGSRALVDDGSVSGRPWSQARGLLFTDG